MNAKTRHEAPFFVSEVQAFDGAVLALFPKNGLDLEEAAQQLNENRLGRVRFRMRWQADVHPAKLGRSSSERILMTTRDLIPSELAAAAKYLGQQKMTLPSGGGDSRGDSSAGESTVIQVLQNAQNWNIVGRNVGTSTNRAPYDMEFEGLLVDVKISSLTGADNTNAKSAIFYLLTGDTNHPTHNKTILGNAARQRNPRRATRFLLPHREQKRHIRCVCSQPEAHSRSNTKPEQPALPSQLGQLPPSD